VRDDGEPEPELELQETAAPGGALPEAPPADTEQPEMSPESDAPGGDAEGDEAAPVPEDSEDEQASADGLHPVRARLLARAAAAKQPRGGIGAGAPERQRASAGGLAAELDALGSGASPPSAPLPGAALSPLRSRAPLSPNMVALFGTLLGLALVASIIALVMQIGPSSSASVAVTGQPAVPSDQAPTAPVPSQRQRAKIPGPWRIADAGGDGALRIVEGKIGAQPFLRAIQDAGLEKKEAYRVFNVLKDLRNLDKCDRSDTFVVLVERASSRVKAFEYVVSKEEVYQAREDEKGELKAKKLDFKIERAQVKGSFVADGGDIDEAVRRGGLERGLSQALTRALDGHMSLDELKRGDVVRVVAQEVTVLGEFSRYAGVEAIEIRSADDASKPFRLYYFRGQKERGYYDDRGRAPYEGGWRKPVQNAPITSHFNPKRMHPVLKKVMPHTGTDFGAPSGAPVGASSYGTVSFIGPAGPSGNLVKIEHPGGIETGYAHLSRFADGLKTGDKVKRLQIIGYVGSTGRSTGPHLHFTAKKNGQFFDAETLNLDGMRVIDKSERDAFAKVKQSYDELLDAIALPAPLPSAQGPTVAASGAPVDEGSPKDDSFATGGPEAVTAPAGPEPAPAEPAKPEPASAPAAVGNPVYLTDKELLKAQSASDDGEVAE